MGENLEVVWAEFSTLSEAVLLQNKENACYATYKVENSAQVMSF